MVERRTWGLLLVGAVIVVIVTAVTLGIYLGRGNGESPQLTGPGNMTNLMGNNKGRRTKRRDPWEINQHICPPVLCPNIGPSIDETDGKLPGTDVEDAFEFFQGDIVIDDATKRRIDRNMMLHNLRNSSPHRYKRAIVKQTARLWKDGIVPFRIDKRLPSKTKKLIRRAMRHYETHTCIRFRKRKVNEKDYIIFKLQPGCWSYIGRVGGPQILSLGPGCDHFGTIVHETGHALGFWHEQSRPDRDRFIRIMKRNIGQSSLKQFSLLTRQVCDSRGYAYDYGSIMHYGAKTYSANTKKTIRVINAGRKYHLKIGQRKWLSLIDKAQLRDMYQCNKKIDMEHKPCAEGWRQHRDSCYLFVADRKEHFAGAHASCLSHGGHLLHIDDEEENEFISDYISSRHRNVNTWRTGGKKVDDTFVWFGQSQNATKPMSYTDWFPRYPGKYTSLGLTLYKGTPIRMIWRGIWAGSSQQKPSFTYPYICEMERQGMCFASKTGAGQDYRGSRDFSQEGITCQAWSSQYPHPHSELTGQLAVDDANGIGKHNFCRNPGGRKARPWCFVLLEKVEWQYCDIRIC
ncbi:hypothetical protein LSAT2_024173 [Lamellibrachia satsuma]|nr:hypothetical protein LSAT2_024173 [Lamellibrachia satsuma]